MSSILSIFVLLKLSDALVLLSVVLAVLLFVSVDLLEFEFLTVLKPAILSTMVNAQ